MASPLLQKLATSPITIRAKSPVFRSFTVGLNPVTTNTKHVSIKKSPSLVTVSVTDDSMGKKSSPSTPKLGLFSKLRENDTIGRLEPRQQLLRLSSFSAGVTPNKRTSPKQDDITWNSPLNSSTIEFSATRNCQALVHSPCRADLYKLQRRRLYHNEANGEQMDIVQSNNATQCHSDNSVSVDCVAELPKSFGFNLRKDSLCRTDSTGSNGPRSAVSTPSSASTPIVGKGGFGSVFIGRYDGRRVAIKQLHNRTTQDGGRPETFCAELNAFKLLRHPNIVKIITFTPGPTAQIVYEYVGRRNLQEIFDDVEGESIDFNRRIRFCRQVADALLYCHLQRLLHLDVKASNVLLTDHGDLCKLADFGCSRTILSGTDTVPLNANSIWAAGGTLIYTAPELLLSEPATAKADVYSYSLLIWQSLSRKIPFEGQHAHTTVYLVVKRGQRPDCDFIQSKHFCHGDRRLLELAKSCWNAQPIQRPSFEQICCEIDQINCGCLK